MRFPLLGKFIAMGLVFALIAIVLGRIGYLVDERRGRQADAIRSVQQSQAGAQAVLGPWLQRQCVEEWEVEVFEDKHRKLQTEHREISLRKAPRQLTLRSQAQAEQRYRGLFKVNGYLSRLNLEASWPDLLPLEPQREHSGSRLRCEPITLSVALADPRGVQQAELTVNGGSLPIASGTEHAKHTSGLHAVLPALPTGESLRVQLVLDLRGTARLALVPAAGQTEWDLRSDWPHPSFGGRFLPVEHQVTEDGFHALWRVSDLASSAVRDAAMGAPLCAGDASSVLADASDEDSGYAARGAVQGNCLDDLAVSFVEPVNPYVLSDRAIKYGLLFVVLTFVAVGLTEVLGGARVRRVHPVQYALVGFALSLFFLLLLALSEHLRFEIAYAAASVACATVLGVYGGHMLGGWRGGAAFGAALALLYGLLYVLLTREQTSLVAGAVGLFAALAGVMLLTRRVDWYRLFDELAAPREGRTITG